MSLIWIIYKVPDIKEGIYKIIKSEYDQPNFDYSPYTWDKMRIKLKNIINNDKVK